MPGNGKRTIISTTASTFCLDRIKDFRFSSHTFDYPDDFSPEKYFNGCIGVITEEVDIEEVELKVSSNQAHYLRELPMHESQKEVERNDEYSIFTLKVLPTFDFIQEILWNGEEMEVLEPLWLRNELKKKYQNMINIYDKQETIKQK